MRQRFSPEQWAQWFDEFDRSAMSVTEFCRRKRVSQNAFYNWRRKLGRADRSAADLNTADTFVPVAMAADDQVIIELPNDIRLHVENRPESLHTVLETLAMMQQDKP